MRVVHTKTTETAAPAKMTLKQLQGEITKKLSDLKADISSLSGDENPQVVAVRERKRAKQEALEAVLEAITRGTLTDLRNL